MFYRDDLLRAAAAQQRKTYADVAEDANLNRATVGRVMDGDPKAGYMTVYTVAKALGFSKIPDEPLTTLEADALGQQLPKVGVA